MEENVIRGERDNVDKLPKLDIKDRKLLFYLSENSRISDTQLAKKIGLSKNAVKYRITRLRKLGVIKQFTSTVNLGASGHYTFTIMLRFNEDIYKDKEIIEYFRNHEFADWVVTLSGHWDIFAEFACKDLFHMSSIIEGITSHFGEVLNTYQVFLSSDTLRVEHLVGEFYSDLKVSKAEQAERRISKYKIDKMDKRILNLLGEDSSLNYLDIAQRLKTTLDVVRYRIKNLVKERIIIKFFSEVSLQKLGYTEYLYILTLRNLSESKFKELKNFIKLNENITYAFVDKNSFNIVFNCAYSSAEGIDTLSRSLRKEFSEVIESQDYHIVKEQAYFNLFPRGLIDL